MTIANAPSALDAATEADLDALVLIEASNPSGWSRAAFAAELASGAPSLFVRREAGRAIGFICVRRSGPDIDIVNIAVAPGARRRGHATTLIRELFKSPAAEGVQHAFLEVRESNGGARNLYRRLGFQETQRRPGFYRDPVEDAVLLRLDVSHLNA